MLDAIRTATESFWDFLSDIAILPLLAGDRLPPGQARVHEPRVAERPRGRVPGPAVRWRPILAAYVSGVGINAIVPARAGDVVRVFLAHRAIPGSSYTTIVSSTVVLTFVDMSARDVVFAWALTQGVLPSLDALSALPAFDYSWVFDDGVIHPGAVIALLGDRRRRRLAPAPLLEPAARAVAQAFAVFDPPTRYVRTVVVWQLADWVAATRDGLVLPRRLRDRAEPRQRPPRPGDDEPRDARPGHAGRDRHRAGPPRLRLPRHRRRRSTLLAFSVGMKLTLTVVNVVVGFTAIFLTLGTVRYGTVVSKPPARPGCRRDPLAEPATGGRSRDGGKPPAREDDAAPVTGGIARGPASATQGITTIEIAQSNELTARRRRGSPAGHRLVETSRTTRR